MALHSSPIQERLAPPILAAGPWPPPIAWAPAVGGACFEMWEKGLGVCWAAAPGLVLERASLWEWAWREPRSPMPDWYSVWTFSCLYPPAYLYLENRSHALPERCLPDRT